MVEGIKTRHCFKQVDVKMELARLGRFENGLKWHRALYNCLNKYFYFVKRGGEKY